MLRARRWRQRLADIPALAVRPAYADGREVLVEARNVLRPEAPHGLRAEGFARIGHRRAVAVDGCPLALKRGKPARRPVVERGVLLRSVITLVDGHGDLVAGPLG